MAKKSSKSSRTSMRDNVRTRAEERQSTGGGTKFIFPEDQKVEFFQPKKGTFHIDILPYEVSVDNHPAGVAKGDLWYQRTIWVHYGIGAEEKKYLCLKTVGKRCPICDARAQMMKSADSDDDIIKALAPKEREIFNIIDLNDEKKGVQLWEISYHLFGKMLEDEIREGDEEFGDFAMLEGGKTLKVRFGEKKLGKNTFLETTRIDFEDRDDYDEDILEDVLDLDDILNLMEYKKLEAVFLEMEEEDEKPAKKSGRSSRKPKDEEEEEEEEKPSRHSSKSSRSSKKPKEDDEEEEEEEKPSRHKPKEAPSKKRSSKKEEPEEGEEEEEKPSKKSSRSSKKTKDEEEEEEECPVEDGEFGKDCDEFDECMDCALWEACKDKQDELNALKKKRR